MSDLAGFLLARIAEDEAVASRWPEDIDPLASDGQVWRDPQGQAIYAPKPRVLAECKAKRLAIQRMINGPTGSEPWDEGWYVAAEEFTEFLALPYADHPDYRQEWKP